MQPSRSDANSTPLSSWIGSASMSARSATTGLPLSRSARRTLVSVGRSGSSPSSCEALGDPRGRLVLVKARLGMAVQMAPPLHDLLVDPHS